MVVSIVSPEAQTARLSFVAGRLFETNSANTLAGGLTLRIPVSEAFDIHSKGTERIVAVADVQVADAIRTYYHCSHNIAEGAGAAPLAP